MANNRMMLRNTRTNKLVTIAKHNATGWWTAPHLIDKMNDEFDNEFNNNDNWEDTYELVLENDLES